MINDFLASIIRLAFIFIFASNSEFGIKGVCLAINISIVVGTFLHFFTIAKLVGFNIILTEFIKVILSGIFMGVGALITFRYLAGEIQNQYIQIGITIFISIIIYIIFLVSLKVIDFKKVPIQK